MSEPWASKEGYWWIKREIGGDWEMCEVAENGAGVMCLWSIDWEGGRLLGEVAPVDMRGPIEPPKD